MSQDIEEIKSKLNIVDVVGDYVPLKKVGANFRARCPFHNEKTPSFYVTPSKQIWYCFGCNLGGDIFEFIKQIESVDFKEALKRLADRAGIVLSRKEFDPTIPPADDRKQVLYELNELAAKFYHKVLTDSPLADAARGYLNKRNFSAKTLSDWQIGYAPDRWDSLFQFLEKKGYARSDMELAGLVAKKDTGGYFDRFRERVTFPIIDLNGHVVGFSARLLVEREGVGKYINSPESPIYTKSRVIFGLFQARNDIRRKSLGVIVEGNIDVIKSHQAGITNVVAVSGTALTENQLDRLSKLTENLTFAFDADSAGRTAAKRALDLAVEKGFTVKLVQSQPGLKDADEVIDKSAALWVQMIEQAQDYLDFYFHQLFDILDPRNAEAKKRAVEDYLGLLGKVTSPIITSHYLQKISQVTGIKEQVLIGELRKPRKDFRTAGQSATGLPAKPAPVPAVELAERRFLGLLFLNPSLLETYLSLHQPEHFQTPKYAEIFKKILKYRTRYPSQPFSFDEFVKTFPNFSTEVKLAIFSTEVGEKEDVGKQELAELSRRLRLTHLQRERDFLTQAIAQAEAAKDNDKKRRLMVEFNTLNQAIQSIQ